MFYINTYINKNMIYDISCARPGHKKKILLLSAQISKKVQDVLWNAVM